VAKEPLSLRARDDARQTALIRQAWSDSGRVYGYRKLTDDLRDQGEYVACRALGQHRSNQRKVPQGRADEEALTADIIALASQFSRTPWWERALRSSNRRQDY
jgi:hypothetical protein